MNARRITAVLACLAALALGYADFGGRPALAADVLGTSGPAISLETRQGRLIRLRRPAATVFIADADIADVQVKTPQLIYIFGKQVGTTTLYVVDGNDAVLLNREVVVNHNLSQLQRAIDQLLPGEDIRVSSINGSIMLAGTASSAAASEDARLLASRFVRKESEIINKLHIDAPQQINLRVRVTEISRTTVKQLGVDWDVLARSGNFVFALATGTPTVLGGLPAFAPVGDFAPPGGGANTANTRNNGANSLFTNFNNSTVDVNSVIDALETEGLIKVLAEPNLSALTGETASFLAGGEFPIPVPQDENTITIKFKKFGVSLGFTPTIVGESRINLKVAPEVSQLSNAGAVNLNGFNIPALTVRRAETTIELASGQSFAIAGLLQNNSNYDIDKVPWLGDIPILGQLFRSDEFRRDETELLIIVTPYIVHPIDSRQIVARAPAGDPGAQLGRREGALTKEVMPAMPEAPAAAASDAAAGGATDGTAKATGGPAAAPESQLHVTTNDPAPTGPAAPAGEPPTAATSAPRRLIGPAGFALE